MKIFDESGSSPNSIVNHLNAYGYMIYLQGKVLRFNEIYCGITNNLDATLTRHRITSYHCVIDCGSKEKASSVEAKMGDLGYDIGNPPHEANGAVEDTRYVYLFIKTPDTDPSLG